MERGTAAGRRVEIQRLEDMVEATAALPLVVGVLSDTHIPTRAKAMPEALLAGLAGSDVILHAGDLARLAVLEPLERIAPTLAVYGNADPWEVACRLPRRALLRAGRWRVGMVHGDGERGTTPERALGAFEDVDVVVFGHSHRPLREQRGSTLLFNPGSATDRRRAPRCTYGRLRLTEDGIKAEIVPL